MPPEHRRLLRLQRLERVRECAKQSALCEAAAAETSFAQLRGLAERTGYLVAGYTEQAEPMAAQDLRQRARFIGALREIAANTSEDADKAKRIADACQSELAQAERSRAAVEDRAIRARRKLGCSTAEPLIGARRRFGMGLE